MTAVLDGNLDYLLFVYGLGLVLLAVALLGLRATVVFPAALEVARSLRPRSSA